MKYLLVFLIGTALLSCSRTPDVESQILQKIHLSKSPSLPLRSIIDINWGKLYIITPYITEKALNDDLLLYKDRIKSTGIDMRDDMSILYFLKDNKLVAEARIKANTMVFNQANRFDSKNHLIYFTPNQELRWINWGGNYTTGSIK